MKYLCDQFCMKQRGRKFARCQRHSIHHPHSALKLPQKVLFLGKKWLKNFDSVGFWNELSKLTIKSMNFYHSITDIDIRT